MIYRDFGDSNVDRRSIHPTVVRVSLSVGTVDANPKSTTRFMGFMRGKRGKGPLIVGKANIHIGMN
jgi:hypothetical protein